MFCFFYSPFPTSPIPELPLLFSPVLSRVPHMLDPLSACREEAELHQGVGSALQQGQRVQDGNVDHVAEKVRERKLFGVTEPLG